MCQEDFLSQQVDFGFYYNLIKMQNLIKFFCLKMRSSHIVFPFEILTKLFAKKITILSIILMGRNCLFCFKGAKIFH